MKIKLKKLAIPRYDKYKISDVFYMADSKFKSVILSNFNSSTSSTNKCKYHIIVDITDDYYKIHSYEDKHFDADYSVRLYSLNKNSGWKVLKKDFYEHFKII